MAATCSTCPPDSPLPKLLLGEFFPDPFHTAFMGVTVVGVVEAVLVPMVVVVDIGTAAVTVVVNE